MLGHKHMLQNDITRLLVCIFAHAQRAAFENVNRCREKCWLLHVQIVLDAQGRKIKIRW